MQITFKHRKSNEVFVSESEVQMSLQEAKDSYSNALFEVISVDPVLGDWDNEHAAQILDQEGSGYAVTSYCTGKEFSDPVTARLWDEAAKAIKDLEDYVNQDTL